ncbi:uncharacterized protein [Littorina saxatilis]|uniref:Upstream activation factor subunit spp27 n=1 Tax=Littorina saxatilis TaxID=31220 RepID=A0AAN9BRJ7_9CAEN
MSDATKADLSKSVKAILKDGDLDQLSAKKIRKMLETEYKADFTERKDEIDKLVMQLITGSGSEEEQEEAQSKQKVSNGTPKAPKRPASPKKETVTEKPKEEPSLSDDDDDDSDIGEIEDYVPIKKSKVQSSKGKKSSSKKVDDEELAKQLQDDEGSRPSRRCKAQPVVRKQKKPRKEGAKGNSVYSRPCLILPPLDGLLDTDKMPRPMIVKRIWEIVKERELLDPKNRQFMICDEQMLSIFGKPRVRMFGVMKYLKLYIKDLPKE